MTPGDNNQVVSESISFDKGDSLTFLKDDVAYTVAPKDDDQLKNMFKDFVTLMIMQDLAENEDKEYITIRNLFISNLNIYFDE